MNQCCAQIEQNPRQGVELSTYPSVMELLLCDLVTLGLLAVALFVAWRFA